MDHNKALPAHSKIFQISHVHSQSAANQYYYCVKHADCTANFDKDTAVENVKGTFERLFL